MGATILARTISSETDKHIVLSKSQFARAFTLPTSWRKARVGIRCFFYADTLEYQLVGPIFGLGWTSTSSSLIGDVSTTSFIGLQHGMAVITNSLRYNTPSSGNMRLAGLYAGTSIAPSQMCSKTGTTYTGYGSNVNLPLFPVASSDSEIAHACMFFDMTYGASTWGLQCFGITGSPFPAVALTATVTAKDFLYLMELDYPTWTNYGYSASQSATAPTWTPAYVNVCWDRETWKLNIADLAVAVWY